MVFLSVSSFLPVAFCWSEPVRDRTERTASPVMTRSWRTAPPWHHARLRVFFAPPPSHTGTLPAPARKQGPWVDSRRCRLWRPYRSRHLRLLVDPSLLSGIRL